MIIVKQMADIYIQKYDLRINISDTLLSIMITTDTNTAKESTEKHCIACLNW